jgi:hypothetical protein
MTALGLTHKTAVSRHFLRLHQCQIGGMVAQIVTTTDGKVTPAEAEWHETWRGQVVTVCNVREALAALGITGAEWVS